MLLTTVKDGDTPMHAAAMAGHIDVTALLLKRGAAPDQRDNVSYLSSYVLVCAL